MIWRNFDRMKLLVFSGVFCVLTAQAAGAAEAKALPSAPVIQAGAAVLMDENGIVLFEKDSHKPLPPASVTKTMTLLLAVEAVESGRVTLAEPVAASDNAWRQGGSQIWLEQGEVMTFHELLISLAVVSANDAAVAIMEHIYGSETAAIAAMNRRAAELGLDNTHFVNVNGLPAADHYMSAYDTALLVREATRHPLYMKTCAVKEYQLRGGKSRLINTNKLLWWYKGADGLKTGWTEAAKYCFAGTAERDGLRLISVVFAAPEPRSHFKESMKLFDWGFSKFKAQSVVKKADAVAKLTVLKGMAESVILVAANDLEILVDPSEVQTVERAIIMDQNVTAPVEAGTKYGQLRMLKAGKLYGAVDLVAEESIDQATFFHALQGMFIKFLAN